MANYREAGVDIEKGDEAVRRLKKHAEATFTDTVLRGIGSFAGAFDASALKGMDQPVLLSTMDGVGTKTVIAAAMAALYRSPSTELRVNSATGTGQRTWNPWLGIGHDIVNHCANDLVCQGAKPLFFLDYIASSALDPNIIEQIVKGMSEACRALGCPLIGGELAEMPQVYHGGAVDIVGTMVGVVEKATMITGENIKEGNILIALPSNGLHTNGYSLARSVLTDYREYVGKLGCTVGEALLKPHTCYANLVLKLHDEIGLKGVAHITGGGIPGNLPRILPEGLGATIERSAIVVPPIFEMIRQRGNVAEDEMFRTFNMGVGMILVVGKKDRDAVLKSAEGGSVIGKIAKGTGVTVS